MTTAGQDTATASGGAVPPGGGQWDVFISYAREDYIQAKDLHDALSGCVTAHGSAPRIYLDVSRTSGTPLGVDWQTFLEEALPRSRHVVALYSATYFDKPVCQWELHEAYKLNPPEGGRLIPLLIDPGAAAKVPYIVNRINWIPTTRPHWIEEVRRAVGLRTAGTRTTLRFDTAVAGAVVGHTLAPVSVTGSVPEGAPQWPADGTVTIGAEPADAELTGTLTVPVVRNRAVFADLAFRNAAAEVRLVTTAPGCEPATTGPFAVGAPEEPPSWNEPDRPVLAARGRPVFFPDGRALAVLDGRTLTVHTAEHEAAGVVELRDRPRLWARGRRLLAVADWSGRVVLAAPDGRVRAVDLPARTGARLTVPGALAFDADDTLYAGLWGGAVWRLTLDGAGPERVLEHRAGVQVLTADGEGLLVGGLDGRLTRYTAGRAGAEHTLEPMLLAMARTRGFVLAVGEQRIHRLDPAGGRLLQVAQPIGAVTAALPGEELTAIVDAAGHGVCFDAELAVRVGFHSVPGARPVAAARGGRLLVLAHPDGSHALVRDGRTTYVSRHPMTLSGDGERAAVSDGERILIVPPGELGGGGPVQGERA
ncbi:toll/interleukin-1 receptor domain-containing protein [Streptomyces sp. NBC_00083]|uniref:toll/interleukin-1 receptor domain-containing protein n=1 Tax=Streptomyces sp. NBC_00083 TaxID=2975647 RepID=UPI0022587EB1|nr:toll/interleukin-1 receptor domain-containing protein [Streptomyces sp. NBC_00083]MCX5385367.1 toll/interleukin-1 receptor domain-containing protein [Streptomyces sp. NBC_00083]